MKQLESKVKAKSSPAKKRKAKKRKSLSERRLHDIMEGGEEGGTGVESGKSGEHANALAVAMESIGEHEEYESSLEYTFEVRLRPMTTTRR